MPKFQIADQSVNQLAEGIMLAHMGELYTLYTIATPEPLKIDFVFALAELDEEGQPVGPAIKHRGYPAAGLCKVVNLHDRTLGRGDAEIQLDYHVWSKMDPGQQEALLAHELWHIMPLKDQEGRIKRDDLRRVKIKLRKHDYDFGWFTRIAELYAADSMEVKQARQIFVEDGQFLMPFLQDPEQSVVANMQQKRKPRAVLRELPPV
jgi:hypothetical protein